jgi:hypothetical protein
MAAIANFWRPALRRAIFSPRTESELFFAWVTPPWGKNSVLLEETIFGNGDIIPYYLRRVIVPFSYAEESFVNSGLAKPEFTSRHGCSPPIILVRECFLAYRPQCPHAGSPGAGKAKSRLSRGFSHGPRPRRHRYKGVVGLDQVRVDIGIVSFVDRR